MMAGLPYAAEADAEISVAELEVLEEAYRRAAASNVHIPEQVRFNYAWGLVRSRYRNDQEKGVRLLQEIWDEDPERRRECTYYLALGYYRLGEYARSRQLNAQMLGAEPHNQQCLSLQQLINDRVQNDGVKGMAAVGLLAGAVALGGILLASLLKGGKKK